jgi:hypothetical protein
MSYRASREKMGGGLWKCDFDSPSHSFAIFRAGDREWQTVNKFERIWRDIYIAKSTFYQVLQPIGLWPTFDNSDIQIKFHF